MKNRQNHTIDVLFSIALFFVFSATTLVVLLLSANIYKGVVADAENNFQTGTALSYITEKVRQHDENGNESIYLTTFDNQEALAIAQTFHDTTYVTYIYEMNGELKETFIQEGIPASASAGTTIMEIGSLEITQINSNLLRISCASQSGIQASTLINVHSINN